MVRAGANAGAQAIENVIVRAGAASYGASRTSRDAIWRRDTRGDAHKASTRVNNDTMDYNYERDYHCPGVILRTRRHLARFFQKLQVTGHEILQLFIRQGHKRVEGVPVRVVKRL